MTSDDENKEMNIVIKKDIISLINKVIRTINIKRYDELSELSNHVIHNASVFQDQDSVSVAVLVYSLYKILTKYNLKTSGIVKILHQIVDALRKDDFKKFRNLVSSSMKLIETIDKEFTIYLDEVIDKAKIKKGIKIYDHGISLARVSEIMNVTQWELLNYLGNVKETDEENNKTRLDVAEEIFGLK